ncbi:MAG: ArsR/SmtB family transcription factor [Sandaracinaceae bacterium]
MTNPSRLDAGFAALADSTRRAILARLVEGEATVNELAAPFAISQPAISRHLKVLEDAGLILRRVDGTRRPCRLAPGALRDLDSYLSMIRDAMETNYARLDAILAAKPRKKGK